MCYWHWLPLFLMYCFNSYLPKQSFLFWYYFTLLIISLLFAIFICSNFCFSFLPFITFVSNQFIFNPLFILWVNFECKLLYQFNENQINHFTLSIRSQSVILNFDDFVEFFKFSFAFPLHRLYCCLGRFCIPDFQWQSPF